MAKSPDDKPPRNLTTADLEMLCDRVAHFSKLAFDQLIASRDARIAQLEHDLGVVTAQVGKSLEEPR